MKQIFKDIIKAIIFAALLLLVFFKFSQILEYKNSNYNKKPFYELSENGGADVLFAGSSHMWDGIFPITLYENFGITSYNAASPGEEIAVTYHVLREMIKTDKPKVVVVDAFLITSDKVEDVRMDCGQIHESMDFMPLNKNKIELARLAAESEDMSPVAFLSSMYAYHYRWKELESRDFAAIYNRQLGACALSGIFRCTPPEDHNDLISEDALEGEGYEYLTKIMDLCKENDMKFILVNIPYSKQSSRRQAKENAYIKAVRDNGFDAINFRDYIDELNIDYSTDYQDSSHANILGATKLTNFMGRYLSENYELADHRLDANAAYWEKLQYMYKEEMLSDAAEAEFPEVFLMYSFHLEGVTPVIYYEDEATLWHSSTLSDLIGIMDIETLPYEALPEDEKLQKASRHYDIITAFKDDSGTIFSYKGFSKTEASFDTEDH